MKKVAVLQSNYLPWKGYFDIIHDVELFIFYDDVQYTKNDWRNRNRIKTAQGTKWITIPAGSDLSRLIHEVRLTDHSWQQQHWRTISQAYARAPHFAEYRPFLEDFYCARQWESLSELNQHLIRGISREFLGITTEFRDSREYRLSGTSSERLLALLKEVGATTYFSGPAAKAYIDEAAFKAENIEIVYKDYTRYPEYPQPHPPFEHAVSVIDLLFSCGSRSGSFIWGPGAGGKGQDG